MKNIKKYPLAVAISLLLAISMLTGCSSASSSPKITTESPAADNTNSSNHSTAADGTSQKATIITYQLPDVAYKESNKEVTFTPEGLMGIPERSQAPVVYILHGSHDMTDGAATPYYKGFEYLVKSLAEQGYLAISINVNQAYLSVGTFGDDLTLTQAIFREHYNRLVEAVNGEPIFEVDLKDKADLSKINLIGHSRGGENITGIIQDSQFKDISFASAIKIAPPAVLEHKYTYADIPTAIILPEYDEDVLDLDGFWDYYYAYDRDIIRKSAITTAYLYGASHAYFNTNVTPIGQAYPGETIKLLKPEAQQDFLVKYTLDFLKVYNNGAQRLTDIINDQTPSRYGIDFMPAVLIPDRDRLLAPIPAKTGPAIHNMTLTYLESSYLESLNQAGPFKMPGLPNRFPLYQLDWEDNTGSLTLPIDYIYYKFAANSVLSIYMALNSPDARNSAKKETIIDVIITDIHNHTETIRMSSANTPALKYQPGKLSDTGFAYEQWSRFCPLGSTLIDLSSYPDLKPEEGISQIEIRPVSKTGSIMLGGIDSFRQLKPQQ